VQVTALETRTENLGSITSRSGCAGGGAGGWGSGRNFRAANQKNRPPTDRGHPNARCAIATEPTTPTDRMWIAECPVTGSPGDGALVEVR
jgi:hypothetical protein